LILQFEQKLIFLSYHFVTKGAESANLFKCQKNNIESPCQNLLSWFISCALYTVREICFYVLCQEFRDEI